jgi:aminoglycoside phosphotransferase (APT) family kinase protein
MARRVASGDALEQRHAGRAIPEFADYIRRYCGRTGRVDIPHWHFYLAFSLFRIAAILQGVWRRSQDGQASGADAAQMGAKVELLTRIGWEIARHGAG